MKKIEEDDHCFQIYEGKRFCFWGQQRRKRRFDIYISRIEWSRMEQNVLMSATMMDEIKNCRQKSL